MVSKLIRLYQSTPIQLKASFWFFSCSFLQKAISVFSMAIFTRFMSAEDYGLISIYNTWSDVFAIFASLNLSVGCFNVGMTKYEDDRGRWVSSLQFLSIITTMVSSAILLLTFPILQKYINLSLGLIVLMAVTSFFSSSINLWTAKQRYVFSYRKLVSITLLYSFSIFIVSFVFILIFRDKGYAKIIGTSLVTLLFGMALLGDNLKGIHPAINKDYMAFAFRYNFSMIPAFIGSSALNQIDRVMIDSMVGRDSAGIYSVAYSAASVIAIASASINATYNPWFMQKFKNKDFAKVDMVGRGVAFTLMAVIILFMLLAPELLKLLAPAEYSEARYIIPAVAGSTFFSFIYTLFCPILQFKMKTVQLSLVTVASGLLNIVLNYIFIGRWGYLAAGYTTYICYLLYGWGTGALAMYSLRKERHIGKIYNVWKLAEMTILLTFAVIVAPITYNHFLIRYGAMLLILAYLAIKMRRIFSVMKNKENALL